jgi:hypothetical protein
MTVGTPVRIQRRRSKGWRMPEGAVYVGRPTKYGNPFDWRHGLNGCYGVTAKQAAVEYYKDFLLNGRGPAAATDEEIAALKGKDLACWCKLSDPCHADVLLEIANAP